MKIAVAFLLVALGTTFDSASAQSSNGVMGGFAVPVLCSSEHLWGTTDMIERKRKYVCFMEELEMLLEYAAKHLGTTIKEFITSRGLTPLAKTLLGAIDAVKAGTIKHYIDQHYEVLNAEFSSLLALVFGVLGERYPAFGIEISEVLSSLNLKLTTVGNLLQGLLPSLGIDFLSVGNVLNPVFGILLGVSV
ncbi:uncharacterized protein O3C94_009396 [Discoglossus pictus]